MMFNLPTKGIAAEKSNFLKIMSCPMDRLWDKPGEKILPMYKMYEPCEKDLYLPFSLNANEIFKQRGANLKICFEVNINQDNLTIACH